MSFVRVLCNVKCDTNDVRYRAYVNEELFIERTWIWGNGGLEELFQIEAPPGNYTIHYELVNSPDTKLSISNVVIEEGDAIVTGSTITILS
jgi:hypothetical protein